MISVRKQIAGLNEFVIVQGAVLAKRYSHVRAKFSELRS